MKPWKSFGEWRLAGVVVAAVQVVSALLMFVTAIPRDFRNIIFFLSLVFPAGLPLLPILKSIHSIDSVFIVISAILNWLFYTVIIHWFIARRRRIHRET